MRYVSTLIGQMHVAEHLSEERFIHTEITFSEIDNLLRGTAVQLRSKDESFSRPAKIALMCLLLVLPRESSIPSCISQHIK